MIDSGADDLSMILLQVVKASAKRHNAEVLKLLRKVLSEGRRYQDAWIYCEEQLWVRRIQEARRNSARSTGSNVESISPVL